MCTMTNKIFEGNKEYIYTYEIIKSKSLCIGAEKDQLNYGIKIDVEIINDMNLEFQYNNSMESISPDFNIVKGFITKICKYCVSPINMNDVIEDLLIQIA